MPYIVDPLSKATWRDYQYDRLYAQKVHMAMSRLLRSMVRLPDTAVPFFTRVSSVLGQCLSVFVALALKTVPKKSPKRINIITTSITTTLTVAESHFRQRVMRLSWQTESQKTGKSKCHNQALKSKTRTKKREPHTVQMDAENTVMKTFGILPASSWGALLKKTLRHYSKQATTKKNDVGSRSGFRL